MQLSTASSAYLQGAGIHGARSLSTEKQPREKPQEDADGDMPTDTQLLDFLLERDGRSRAGLLAIYMVITARLHPEEFATASI